MPAPCEFTDRKDLIRTLTREKARLAKFFDQGRETLEEVVRICVASNTFRAFRRMPLRPSVVFRQWAFSELSRGDSLTSLERICSQKDYDKWLKNFAEKLSSAWKSAMGGENAMHFGARMKLCNLLLKRLIICDDLSTDCRGRLINLIHVPLDQYALVTIRNCIDPDDQMVIGNIPPKPSMKFAHNEDVYMRIQRNIRAIAEAAGVPPIFIDVLAWDGSHRPSISSKEWKSRH